MPSSRRRIEEGHSHLQTLTDLIKSLENHIDGVVSSVDQLTRENQETRETLNELQQHEAEQDTLLQREIEENRQLTIETMGQMKENIATVREDVEEPRESICQI